MRRYWIYRGLKMAFFFVLAIIVFAYVFMLLWNWLLPDLFSLPEITFLQSVGLLILSKMLFGGFKKGGGGHWHRKRAWKNKFQEKVSKMTPEEKEEFKEKMKNWSERWHCGPYALEPEIK